MTSDSRVAEGHIVAFGSTLTGTHDGMWPGRPATGRPFAMNGMNLERHEDDRVVEHFSFPDLLGLFRQLGFM
jgi:predicted ester cyclase